VDNLIDTFGCRVTVVGGLGINRQHLAQSGYPRQEVAGSCRRSLAAWLEVSGPLRAAETMVYLLSQVNAHVHHKVANVEQHIFLRQLPLAEVSRKQQLAYLTENFDDFLARR